MLTESCKKKLKVLLKELYNIDCYRIVQSQHDSYNYFYFTLICICENKGFEMLLTVSRNMRHVSVLRTNTLLESIQPDIEADAFIDDYDFTLHIDTKNTDLIRGLSSLMYENPIMDTIQELNTHASIGIDNKYYMVYSKVIPLSGIMTKNKGWFDLKTVCKTPYLVGNLCSSFNVNQRSGPVTAVLFNIFMFGERFDYVTSKSSTNVEKHTIDSLLPYDSPKMIDFKKSAFQEFFFKYSSLFNFVIEGITREELCELDIVDFLKYIEVQKMAQI